MSTALSAAEFLDLRRACYRARGFEVMCRCRVPLDRTELVSPGFEETLAVHAVVGNNILRRSFEKFEIAKPASNWNIYASIRAGPQARDKKFPSGSWIRFVVRGKTRFRARALGGSSSPAFAWSVPTRAVSRTHA